MRERRPDAGPGIVSAFLRDHSERVRIAETERPWTELVERVRSGPPVWNPMHIEPVDALANSVEFFVHHEDVRRAQPGWTVRPLDPSSRTPSPRRSGGRAGCSPARRPSASAWPPTVATVVRLRKGTPAVTIRGPIGECVLYVYGRKDVAAVTLDGPADAVTSVAAAPFGL